VRWTTLAGATVGLREVSGNIVFARFPEPVDFRFMAMVTVVTGLAQMHTDLGISAAIVPPQDGTKDRLFSLYWLNVFAGWGVARQYSGS
jgi:O-antigen/teichoic acid export membrane protein